MQKVGWIGTGVMGAAQAGQLVKAGYPVKAYNHHPKKALEKAQQYGFEVCTSIAEAAAAADFVFVMVGDPADVEQVFCGPGGLFDSVRPGTVVVDMTTSSPTLAQRLFQLGQEKGISVLDAPVSGGDKGARSATLSIMVGGEQQAFDRALPLLQCMGKTILHMGPAGFGQHTKAANQIAVAGATAAYTEAILYAEKAGLDPRKMLEAIGGGAAGSWQITNMAPRALEGDFAPGFYVRHFIKDMKIIQQEASSRGISLKMLDCVLELYQQLAAAGGENEGTQALIRFYRQQTASDSSDSSQ